MFDEKMMSASTEKLAAEEILATRINKIKIEVQPLLAEMIYHEAGLSDEEIFEERELAGQKVRKIKSDLLMSLMLRKFSGPEGEEITFGKAAGDMIEGKTEVCGFKELLIADDFDQRFGEMARFMLERPGIRMMIDELKAERQGLATEKVSPRGVAKGD